MTVTGLQVVTLSYNMPKTARGTDHATYDSLFTILLQYGKEPDAATKAKWSKKRSAATSAVAATEDNGEGNKMAERVLLRVGQKLNGMEEGQGVFIDRN